MAETLILKLVLRDLNLALIPIVTPAPSPFPTGVPGREVKDTHVYFPTSLCVLLLVPLVSGAFLLLPSSHPLKVLQKERKKRGVSMNTQ